MIADRQQLTLADVDTRWKAAQDRYRRDLAKLYHADGSKIFSDKQHASQQEALETKLREAADQAQAGCQAVIDACDSKVAALAIDPLLQIHNSAQLEERERNRGLIKEDCMELPLPALTDLLTAITQHGSTIERLLYVRYAGRRLQSSAEESNLGWIECKAALSRLEGGEKGADRKAAETVKQQAYRQMMRVNIDLSGLIGGLRVDSGERSMAAKQF